MGIPLAGLGGVTSWGVNVGSFNTISQGNVPFSPGFGPIVQVPVIAIVTHALPKFGLGRGIWKALAENPNGIVNQSLFAHGRHS